MARGDTCTTNMGSLWGITTWIAVIGPALVISCGVIIVETV